MHLIIAVAFQNVEEKVGNGGKLLSRTVERDYRILKIRCDGIVGNLFYFLLCIGNSFLECRQVMFGFNLVERRGLPMGFPLLG